MKNSSFSSGRLGVKWNDATNYQFNLNIKEFNIIDSNEDYISPSLTVTQTESVYNSASSNTMYITTGDYIELKTSQELMWTVT